MKDVMIWEIEVIAQKLINRIHDRELHDILVLFGERPFLRMISRF